MRLQTLLAIIILSGVTIGSAYGAPEDFSFAKKITINSAEVNGDLDSNFVFLFDRTDTDISEEVQNDCDDIAFFDDSNSTQYDHEIEDCDITSDHFTIWVEIADTISSSSDTDFFIYYGDPDGTNQEDITGTWDGNYEAVYHLHDDFLDSTSNNNDGTNSGSTDAVCLIADCQDFDGVNDLIDIPFDATLEPQNITLSAWARLETSNSCSTSANYGVITHDFTSHTDPYYNYHLRQVTSSNPAVGCQIYSVISDGSHGTDDQVNKNNIPGIKNTWTHMAVTYNGTDIDLYVNGTHEKNQAQTDAIVYHQQEILVGNAANFAADYDGKIDEPRIQNTPRGADWIDFEFCNQIGSGVCTSYTVGNEETLGGAGGSSYQPEGKYIWFNVKAAQNNTLGGVFSETCPAGQFVTGIDETGSITCATP